MKLTLYSFSGEQRGDCELPDSIFNRAENNSLVTQFLRVYEHHAHGGVSTKKTRAEVRGGGKKPWAQKGTGRARHGSRRSPLWVGGGLAHGPKPSALMGMPRAMRQAALCVILSQRVRGENLCVVESHQFEAPKTKQLIAAVQKLPTSGSVLFVTSAVDSILYKSARNIPRVSVVTGQDLNVYDIVSHTSIVLLQDAIASLEGRLTKQAMNSHSEDSA